MACVEGGWHEEFLCGGGYSGLLSRVWVPDRKYDEQLVATCAVVTDELVQSITQRSEKDEFS